MTAIGCTMNSAKRTDLILFVSSGLALYFTVILSGIVAHKLDASLAASPTNSGLLIGSIFAFSIISLVLYLLKKTGIGRAIYVLVLNSFYTDEIATAFKNQIDLKSRMRSRKILKADT
ncbi:MAG: hypothetical protein IAF58_08245 [Leptolyngbya sp.]|nr:hypothetical protein [Candidatus Melainabacteria bacterium]